MRLSQKWCDKILEHKVDPGAGSSPYLSFDPVDGRKWISCVKDSLAALVEKDYMPIILCPAEIRRIVYDSLERDLPRVIVLSYNEVLAAGKNVNLEILGDIDE